MPDEERWMKLYNNKKEWILYVRLTPKSYNDYITNGKFTEEMECEIMIDARAIMKADF